MAEVAAAAVGTPGRYVDVPLEHLATGIRQAGTPDWLADALIALEGVKAQGWAAAVSPAVAEVLGRPPESFASFLARRA